MFYKEICCSMLKINCWISKDSSCHSKKGINCCQVINPEGVESRFCYYVFTLNVFEAVEAEDFSSFSINVFEKS